MKGACAKLKRMVQAGKVTKEQAAKVQGLTKGTQELVCQMPDRVRGSLESWEGDLFFYLGSPGAVSSDEGPEVLFSLLSPDQALDLCRQIDTVAGLLQALKRTIQHHVLPDEVARRERVELDLPSARVLLQQLLAQGETFSLSTVARVRRHLVAGSKPKRSDSMRPYLAVLNLTRPQA